MQQRMHIKLNTVARNIFITALSRAVSKQSKGKDYQRRCKLVPLAQDIWAEVEPAEDVDNFNTGLGASLCLCAIAKMPVALKWANELWSWADNEPFEKNEKVYADYIRMLEVHKQHDQVNVLLPKFQKSIQ